MFSDELEKKLRFKTIEKFGGRRVICLELSRKQLECGLPKRIRHLLLSAS